MAVLTVANIILHSRILALDTSTTEPGLTDAQYTSLFNEAYLRWVEAIEMRPKFLTPTAAGLASVAASTKSVVLSDATVYEPLQIHKVSGSSATTGTPLERVEPHVILALLDGASNGTTAKWAAIRTPATSSADIGKWTVYLYPPPDATAHFSLVARCYPAVLTTSDTPDVSEPSAYTLARIVAVRAATALGRDGDFLSAIAQPIPDDIKSAFGIVRSTSTKPVERGMEAAV